MPTKILIVEDEPAIAENIKALLQAKGFEADCAFDGAEAVAMARRMLPDLILLDIMLPKMGGFDVCRIIKSDPILKRARIIMVTGLGRNGDVETAFSNGADDYLFKPFDSERLFKKISKVMSAPRPPAA
ncbi:MAG TPA: two-component system response regulator [Elusimicrobia bacterium]|nr:two-component system response regulator [Elusimicrobiota bacterium]HBT62755.1 two-component system response regulator [Elusimicrobiota bacterium]